MKRRILTSLPIAIMGALFLALFCASEFVLPIANTLSDALYQQPGPTNSQIIIIGMDEEAVDEYGTMPWSRDIFARAISYLNSDPQKMPAVIGVDTLFTGQSSSPENDTLLAQVAGENDNVVLATTATFGNRLVELPDGSFYMDNFFAYYYEEPYEQLAQVTEHGHVNAMADDDGILRHAIWEIELPDGRTVPSFHQTIYRKYMDYTGEPYSASPPTDANNTWYLPFSAGPFGFDDGFSITQLVNGTLDPDIFAGKIVLIGPYSTGMLDDYITSIDHAAKMYGVEYQANAIAALLDSNFKTEIFEFPQIVSVYIISFVCFMWFFRRRIISSTIAWLTISAGWVALCIVFWNMGYVLQVLYIPLAATASFILSVAMNYSQEVLEKSKVTNTFRRYVAPQVVSELLKGDKDALELGGKLADIAVLMVDIRGFTAMAEKFPPSIVVEIINKYLTMTSKCIFDNDGTLDKYIGDCTMALWGAPLPQEDCAYKAVKCALSMMHFSEELGCEINEKYGQFLHFGIGISYGSAVVGNIGSPTRMDYTAIGDTVNTAARLENNAPSGCIYVTPSVANELAGRVIFESLGNSVKLKGKNEEIEIFKVVGLA